MTDTTGPCADPAKHRLPVGASFCAPCEKAIAEAPTEYAPDRVVLALERRATYTRDPQRLPLPGFGISNAHGVDAVLIVDEERYRDQRNMTYIIGRSDHAPMGPAGGAGMRLTRTEAIEYVGKGRERVTYAAEEIKDGITAALRAEPERVFTGIEGRVE